MISSTPSNELTKVLYVEDDPDIRLIAGLALEQVGGLSVAMASSGAEALAMAPEVQPDLILLDVMMPGMDGLTTLARLRASPVTHSMPVVFMTAKVQERETELYRKAGAIGVIPKPFDPMTLADQVREFWRQAHEPSIAHGHDA